jgi:lipopolysaccharide/colanic/teichoic acid biosynthesis glycosyltransferase
MLLIMDIIRVLDFAFSLIGLILLAPILIVLACIIKLTSKGPVFYMQSRVGKNGKDFKVFKFRSMFTDADKKGLLTVGGKDNRITPVGYYLRKYKLDELPQLLNVLKGEMSIVGPRPEVRRYVDLYNAEQRQVLNVLPGITDYASIAYRNENELLGMAANPEEMYVKEIMPKKIELNFSYIHNRNLKEYFTIIWRTVTSTVGGK